MSWRPSVTKYQKLYVQNFMFFYIIVKLFMFSTTLSLDVGQILHTFLNRHRHRLIQAMNSITNI